MTGSLRLEPGNSEVMMKRGFWNTDALIGVIISLLVLIAFAGGFLQGLERKTLGLAIQLFSHSPSAPVAPRWGGWVSTGAVLAVAAYLAFWLPQLGRGRAAMTSLIFLLGLLATYCGLLLGAGLWIQLFGASGLLLLGHLALIGRRYWVPAVGKNAPGVASADGNRMLGLAFQGQGQLDRAFDKFHQAPMSVALMADIYNLGLDFEAQHQFKKAVAVFSYLAEHNATYRDLPSRLGLTSSTAEGLSLVRKPLPAQPLIGPYQIEKEIGKGAMGAVYLGRDTQSGCPVALKTMALAQAFDADELVEVRQRFFREAEAAGQLKHPGIITILDAGEAQGLAYIAMEFLPGGDLVSRTKTAGLLPLPQVLSILARVAEALDYAHRQQVVHRDIKPANIIYDPATDLVKVTDFGIARITDSSRTKTGMVLGTPSYMSPEQLAGSRVDGRSDLFSLGVMLYQMSCGQPPFIGNSLAQLMFRIANEAPADILSINPSLPPALLAVLDRALRKKPEERYQRGADMAADLLACLESLPAGQPFRLEKMPA